MAIVSQNANPTLERLENQIEWYDRKSGYNQTLFKWLKILTMASAALVPAFSMVDWGRPYAAALGVAMFWQKGCNI